MSMKITARTMNMPIPTPMFDAIVNVLEEITSGKTRKIIKDTKVSKAIKMA